MPMAGDEGIFTPEEARTLVGVGTVRDRAHTLLQFSGVRQGEVAVTTWGNVDWTRSRLTVLQTRSGGVVSSSTKTDAGRRVVPLCQTTLEALDAHRSSVRSSKDGDLVFPNADGRPRSQPATAECWARLLRRAGLKYRSPHHACRASFMSWLETGGVPQRFIELIVGHSGRSVAAKFYFRFTNSEWDQHAERVRGILDAIFTGPAPSATDTTPSVGIDGNRSGTEGARRYHRDGADGQRGFSARRTR